MLVLLFLDGGCAGVELASSVGGWIGVTFAAPTDGGGIGACACAGVNGAAGAEVAGGGAAAEGAGRFCRRLGWAGV